MANSIEFLACSWITWLSWAVTSFIAFSRISTVASIFGKPLATAACLCSFRFNLSYSPSCGTGLLAWPWTPAVDTWRISINPLWALLIVPGPGTTWGSSVHQQGFMALYAGLGAGLTRQAISSSPRDSQDIHIHNNGVTQGEVQ